MRYHEEMGRRVLVFIDEIGVLQEYSRILDRDFVDGSLETAEQVKLVERMKVGAAAQHRTLLFNSVGDASLDIPNADVVIEISRMGGSQRQAGQRAGRVQRAKCGVNEGIYYLVYSSNSDSEGEFVTKRAEYLSNMGYSVVSSTRPLAEAEQAARIAQQTGNKDANFSALTRAMKEVKPLLTSTADVAALLEWVSDGSKPPSIYPVPWRAEKRQLPKGRG